MFIIVDMDNLAVRLLSRRDLEGTLCSRGPPLGPMLVGGRVVVLRCTFGCGCFFGSLFFVVGKGHQRATVSTSLGDGPTMRERCACGGRFLDGMMFLDFHVVVDPERLQRYRRRAARAVGES